jgi:predicted nucleic acid-binding protein
MGTANVQTQVDAWRVFEALVADPRVVYLDEQPGLSTIFKSMTQLPRPAHRQWTDAYLAAFAATLGLDVVTLDTGLTGFPGVTVKLLVP